jgi:hypothetical protein
MNKRAVSPRSCLKFMIALLMTSGCAAQQTTTVADTVLINGHVFTGTPESSYAEAIALKGPRILAFGTSRQISSRAGPVTSITLIEFRPALRVAQLSAINSPLRVRLVPDLAYQEQNRGGKPEYPPVPAQLADRVSVSGEK